MTNKELQFYELVSNQNEFILYTNRDIRYSAGIHGQVWGCQLYIILKLTLHIGSHMRNQTKKIKGVNLFKRKWETGYYWIPGKEFRGERG